MRAVAGRQVTEDMRWDARLARPAAPDGGAGRQAAEDIYFKVSVEAWAELFPGSAHGPERMAAAANTAFEGFGVENAAQAAHLLAQCAYETGGFAHHVESTMYSAARLLDVFPRRFRGLGDARAVVARGAVAIAERIYGGRMGNGPEGSGDGDRFRGRGWIMLTGRAMYEEAGRELALDLLADPTIAEGPEVAARIAAWYFNSRGCIEMAGEATDEAVDKITRAVNGGMTGRSSRRAWFRAIFARLRVDAERTRCLRLAQYALEIEEPLSLLDWIKGGREPEDVRDDYDGYFADDGAY